MSCDQSIGLCLVNPLLGLGLQAQQVSPHVAAEQRHAAVHQLPVLVLLQHQQGLHRLGDEPSAHTVQEWLQTRLDTPRDKRLSYLFRPRHIDKVCSENTEGNLNERAKREREL